jgi:hypothetical protein
VPNDTSALRAAAAVLASAGPASCRTPPGFVVRRRRDWPLAPGIEHGAARAGCRSGLTVVVFALGLMSLVATAVARP